MLLIDHASQAVDWRGRDKNVAQRTLISAETGANNLTIWELHSPVDTGAPMHVHPHEEAITVLAGRIIARIGEERVEAHIGQTIYMPANVPHGFRVVGDETAHLLVTFPVANVEFEYVHSRYNHHDANGRLA